MRRRPLCQICKKRPALASRGAGEPKVMKGHDLCGQCWRRIGDSYDAQLKAAPGRKS